jgi:RND superfamily putative drug exporter
MVAVFQHGWGAGLVGAQGVGAIESWIPLFAFVILFGLSMDYQVFVVSRIREAHERGLPTRDAVAHGIGISAGVVTSAAVIMVAVFAVFGTLSMTTFKQLGVGLAVAILLDATVVRAVLLPATLAALGDRTWWLPKRLASLGGTAAPEVVEEERPLVRAGCDLSRPAMVAGTTASRRAVDRVSRVDGPPGVDCSNQRAVAG